jgi:predicted metal-dependent hydrolase
MPEITKIIRTKRKTISLVVQRDGSLVVRAPLRTPEKTIRELVQQKADWIARSQEQMRQKQPAQRQFSEGETLPLLGKQHPIKIVPRQRASLNLQGGEFRLAEKAQPRAREVFALWYKQTAAILLPARLEALAKKHNLRPKRVRISSARTRWGSCSTSGTISLTWRLVMAPPEVIDYVIIHELAHIPHPNHSKNFWDTVATLMPDYKKHINWLKQHGQSLNF